MRNGVFYIAFVFIIILIALGYASNITIGTIINGEEPTQLNTSKLVPQKSDFENINIDDNIEDHDIKTDEKEEESDDNENHKTIDDEHHTGITHDDNKRSDITYNKTDE